MMPGFAVEDFQPMTFPDEPPPRRPHPDEYDGPGRWWISGDYLVAWLRSGRVAPLVTTGPVGDPNAGVLGSPGTVTLFGGDLDFGAYHGFKAELGVWLDEERRYSLDLGGFYLPGDDINFTAASDAAGNPVLVRPVINADTGQEAGFLVARPGFAAGSTSVFAETEFFGVETNLRRHLDCSRQLRAEGLFGFRFLRLDEGVTVVDRLTPLNGLALAGVPLNPGDVLTDVDSFQASNRFYGLQLGGQLRWDLGRLNVGDRWETGRVNLNLFAKLALGINDQSVNIGGLTTAGGQAFPAGILALASNSGDFSRGVFSMVPEFGINLSLEVVKNFHVRTGYSFLLWTDVVRPGEQIDRTVNPALVPSDVTFGAATGPARPAFSFQDELFWAHQFHVGIEFRR
jgi:hypothetical protein